MKSLTPTHFYKTRDDMIPLIPENYSTPEEKPTDREMKIIEQYGERYLVIEKAQVEWMQNAISDMGKQIKELQDRIWDCEINHANFRKQVEGRFTGVKVEE